MRLGFAGLLPAEPRRSGLASVCYKLGSYKLGARAIKRVRVTSREEEYGNREDCLRSSTPVVMSRVTRSETQGEEDCGTDVCAIAQISIV